MRGVMLFALAIGAIGLCRGAEVVDAAEESARFDQQSALRVSAQAVGQLLGDYSLLDRDGRPIQFSRFRGKPLLVSMIFTKCTQACPMTTRYLREAVRAMQEAFGADSFAVLSVGFDSASDTPVAMRSFAKRQGVDLPNWEFASADAANVSALARAVGFSFRPSSAGYDHISQLTIVDSQGRVFGQVYGDDFELPSLGEPLKQLVGRAPTHFAFWQNVGRRIRLFCTTFDPSTGRYRTDYSFFIGMLISAAMIVPFGIWLGRELRRVWSPAGRGA